MGESGDLWATKGELPLAGLPYAPDFLVGVLLWEERNALGRSRALAQRLKQISYDIRTARHIEKEIENKRRFALPAGKMSDKAVRAPVNGPRSMRCRTVVAAQIPE
jgi:hypothetical protein